MFPHMYKVRPRGSAERSSVDEGKPEWAGRRSSGKWPPASEQQDGGLKQSPSSGNMAACPPPIPAPPLDAQDDLSKVPVQKKSTEKVADSSPVPWRIRPRSRSGSPALQHGAPLCPGTRSTHPEDSSLRVPEGGRGFKSRSASPKDEWGAPREQLSTDQRIRSSPSSATASPRVRRKWPPSETETSGSLSDLRHRDASPATDSEVRKWAPLPPRPRTRGPPYNTGSVGDISSSGISQKPPEISNQNVEEKTDTGISPDKLSKNNTDEVREPIPEFLEPVGQSILDNLDSENNESNIKEPLPEFLDTSDKDTNSREPCRETIEGSRHEFPGTSVPPVQDGKVTVEAQPEIMNSLHGNQEEIDEPKDTTTAGSAPVTVEPEVSNEWKDLLEDALSSYVLEDSADPSGDLSLDMSQNAFFQAEAPAPELFQGSSMSYIPSSKEEFLQKQREEDQKYILSALEQEEAELREPEPKDQRPNKEADAGTKGKDELKASDDNDDRPWSPGPPIFKKDIERHRQQAPHDSSSSKTKPTVRKSILKKTPTGTIIHDDEGGVGAGADEAAEASKKHVKEVTYDDVRCGKALKDVSSDVKETQAAQKPPSSASTKKTSKSSEAKARAKAERGDGSDLPKEREKNVKSEPKTKEEKKTEVKVTPPVPPPPPPSKAGPPPPPPPPPGAKCFVYVNLLLFSVAVVCLCATWTNCFFCSTEAEESWWQNEGSDNEEYESDGSIPQAPPPPPGSVPPPPPKPFGSKVDPSSAMPRIRKGHMETIKKAVRTTRPDWHALMKNLEEGVKLKHVKEINDRSQPILPGSRGKNGKFVYESEKPTIVNELLHEIQRGVKLRRVRTDDRSKPDFNRLGLKKFRRQITVEEKKKVKPEDPETLPSSSDDEDDIDHMRDDLEATKTQLADEIKKSQKLEREKKVLKIDIEALHSEVKKLKRQLKEVGIEDKPMVNGEEGIMPKLTKSMSKLRMSEKEAVDFDELDTIEAEIKELNGQIESQKMRANAFENKVFELEEKLKVADTTADEWEGRAIFFEKKFKALQKDQSIELPDIGIVGTQTDPVDILIPEGKEQFHSANALDGFGAAARKSGSRRSFASQINRMESFQEESDEETSSSSEEESEEYDDEDADDDQTIAEEDDGLTDEEREARRVKNEERKLKRDIEFWANKLEHMKAKEANVEKEKNNLRERIKKFYRDMYQERVDYLKSKNELDELVRQLKDPEELAEEEDDEEEEDEEEQHEDEPGWWFDKPNLKPKKLKKKKVKRLNADGEEEEEDEEEEEEDLEDLSQLEEPCWSDSEGEESDPDDENDSLQVRVNFLQSRVKKHENKMNAIRKDNYLLKTEVDTCKEKYNAERLRRRRLEEELNVLLSDMQ
ncbi:hypothetical protein FHG87_003043 [Trinorchestia longiramus]|nr:hypothetical protein FHG87_003043 [Trinorchestia longiramus]